MAEINYPYTHNSEMSPQIILTSLHKRQREHVDIISNILSTSIVPTFTVIGSGGGIEIAGCGILPEDEAVAPGTFSDDVDVDEHSDFDGEPALSLELVLGDC